MKSLKSLDLQKKNPFKPTFWTMVTLFVFMLALFFLIYPLLGLFTRSFSSAETGKVTLANYVDFFKLPYYFSTLKHSFAVSLTTTFFALLIGIPMGYVVARYNIPGKKILNAMVIISLLSPFHRSLFVDYPFGEKWFHHKPSETYRHHRTSHIWLQRSDPGLYPQAIPLCLYVCARGFELV